MISEESTIGPYRILEPLGEGGMGVVYRARHVRTDHSVAVKTIKLPAPHWLESIRREILALTRIHHPGIVRIHDHGVDQGRPWYAMDLFEGESLADYHRRIWGRFQSQLPTEVPRATSTSRTTPMEFMDFEQLASHAAPLAARESSPPAAAGELSFVLRLMRRVCAALSFLHGEGLINCDLKPENIMIGTDSVPVIIDFGLMSQFPGGVGRESLESSRGTSGTWAYMSPEQIRGDFLDARADLYAVGCILYELVAGKKPFVGPGKSVLAQHLSASVDRPSLHVSDLPPALERLILNLLEKDLANRIGYAEELAAALAELTGDPYRLADYPPPRPYLYRPKFTGRTDVLSRVAAARDGASARLGGALVLIGGESGVGKTRCAMQLTKQSSETRMRVVTAECSLFAPGTSAGFAPTPLQPLRPLLQAVADRCEEGGPECADRLLGPRAAVLGLFEPQLARLHGSRRLPSPAPLPEDQARRRLFSYLRETLAAFAEERPLFLVLDDLQWADELTLGFLASLPATYFEQTPILILGTYRTEETTAALQGLINVDHVMNVALSRLGDEAVCSMIGDMLAMAEPPPAFVRFLVDQTEGNPFFVTEYLRTAVAERAIYRTQLNSWSIADPESASTSYQRLPLPNTLRDLIGRVLDRLSPRAQRMAYAAAVLGREMQVEVLSAVVEANEIDSLESLSEVLGRHVLEQHEVGKVHFIHDKIREVAHARIPPTRLAELHRNAARVLEAYQDSHSRIGAAILGQHFAAGLMPDRAGHYLGLAADRARAAHATLDAIGLYREAIVQTRHASLRFAGEYAQGTQRYTELQEGLGDVLALSARRDEARAAYEEALGARDLSDDEMRSARLYRKMGKTWLVQHQYDQALQLFGLAESALGRESVENPTSWRAERFHLQMDLVFLNYYLGRVAEMEALIHKLEPTVEQHGTDYQRAKLYEGRLLLGCRRDRYVVSTETVSDARAAVTIWEAVEDLAELPMARFNLGFALLHHGDFHAAERELKGALSLAERVGNATVQCRCLTYLTMNLRMQQRLEEATVLCERAYAASSATEMAEYIGLARANQAWIAHRRGDAITTVQHARAALDLWARLAKVLVFPFQWTALVPLLQVELAKGDLVAAVDYVRHLLDEVQQAPPASCQRALASAVRIFETNDLVGTRAALEAALVELGKAGYC